MTACTSPIEIFENEANQFMSASQLQNEIISDGKIAALPEPVERFFTFQDLQVNRCQM